MTKSGQSALWHVLTVLLAEEGLDLGSCRWMAGLVKAAQPYCTAAHLNSPFSMQLNKKLYKSQCKRPETAQSPSAIQRIKSVHVVLEGESQITWNRDGPVVTLSLRAMTISSEVTGECFGFPSQVPLKLGRSFTAACNRLVLQSVASSF